jgi:hypothetical protein
MRCQRLADRKIEAAAQAVLAARALYPSSTLADLCDPLTMPLELSRAYRVLDKAAAAACGKTSFATDAERVAFLFGQYQRLVG